MTKESHIDLYLPFTEAVKNNATIVTILINGKRFPHKAFKATPWLLTITDDGWEIGEEKGLLNLFRLKTNSLKKISKFGIEKVEIGLVQKAEGGDVSLITSAQGGGRLRVSLQTVLRLEIHFKYDDSIVLLCTEYDPAPQMIQWLEENEIPVADPFQLKELFQQKLDCPPATYIHQNFSTMLESVSDEKYKIVYKNYRKVANEDN